MVLQVLASSTSFAAVNLLPVLISRRGPISSNRLRRNALQGRRTFNELARLRISMMNLSTASILQAITLGSRVHARASLARFQVRLTRLWIGQEALAFGDDKRPIDRAISMILIGRNLSFRIQRVVGLSRRLSNNSVLSWLHVRRSWFSIGDDLRFRFVLPFSGRRSVLTRILRIVFRLIRLGIAMSKILRRALHGRFVLFLNRFVVFLNLGVFFTTSRAFLMRALMLLRHALFTTHVGIRLCFLNFIIRLILLRNSLHVARRILLFNRFELHVRGLRVRIKIARAGGRITFLRVDPFFRRLFLRSASLFKAGLCRKGELRLPIRASVIVRLSVDRIDGIR